MRNSSSNFKNSPSCLLLTPEVLQTPGGRVEEGGALDVAHEDPPLPAQHYHHHQYHHYHCPL